MVDFAALAKAAEEKKNAQKQVGDSSGQASTQPEPAERPAGGESTRLPVSNTEAQVAGRSTNPFAGALRPTAAPAQSADDLPKSAEPSAPDDAPVNRLLSLGGGSQAPSVGTTDVGGLGDGTDADAGTAAAAESIRSLDDLANVESAPPTTTSGFADETPAQKPTREFPQELTRQQEQFIQLIDGVFEIVHDTDLIGNVIKSIMIELKANPEYTKLIAPDDVRLWVRAMRESMGLARVKKTEAKAKRASGGGRGKSKVVDADMLKDLEDMGIDINA